MTRIEPLTAPYEPDVEKVLTSMMPSGVPPIGLFRTFARNLPMADAMRGWGGYELGRTLSLSMRDREILIDRTCARCGCEYEWGVHVVFFAERVDLGRDQVASITHGSSVDPCWTTERDRLLLDLADALHDHATVDDELWVRLRDEFSEAALLDAFMLCGWYHAISFTANAAAVASEPGTPTFEEYR